SVLAVAVVFAVAITANGGFEAFNTMMVATFQKMWESIAENRNLPKSLDLHQLAVQLNWTLPPMMSAGAVIFYTLNVWLAARIAQTSGLLEAPWPDIPRHLRVPRVAALLLAVSLGLSFTGGLLGLGSRIVSAAILAALALQGLAVIH